MLITLSRRGLHEAMMWLQLFLYRFYAVRIIPGNKWELLREHGPHQSQCLDNVVIALQAWCGLDWMMIHYFLASPSPLHCEGLKMRCEGDQADLSWLDVSCVCGTDVGVQECSRAPPPQPPVQSSVAPQSSASSALRHNLNNDQRSKIKPVETLVLDHFSLRYPLLSQYCGS